MSGRCDLVLRKKITLIGRGEGGGGGGGGGSLPFLLVLKERTCEAGGRMALHLPLLCLQLLISVRGYSPCVCVCVSVSVCLCMCMCGVNLLSRELVKEIEQTKQYYVQDWLSLVIRSINSSSSSARRLIIAMPYIVDTK